MTEDELVGILASRYSWPGADREDVIQEAWFALERCRPKWRPGGKAWPYFAWMCAERHLLEVQRRECYRRPRLYSLEDRHSTVRMWSSASSSGSSCGSALELELPPRSARASTG